MPVLARLRIGLADIRVVLDDPKWDMAEMTMLDSPVRGTTTLLVSVDLPAAHARF